MNTIKLGLFALIVLCATVFASGEETEVAPAPLSAPEPAPLSPSPREQRSCGSCGSCGYSSYPASESCDYSSYPGSESCGCASPCDSVSDCEPKPNVFVNRQPGIVVNRKPQHFVVDAGAPVIIKPAPVVIQRPGSCEYRPHEQTISSPPIIVNKKIIKIDRPIVKKYYHETCQETELPEPSLLPVPTPIVSPPCGSPCHSPCDERREIIQPIRLPCARERICERERLPIRLPCERERVCERERLPCLERLERPIRLPCERERICERERLPCARDRLSLLERLERPIRPCNRERFPLLERLPSHHSRPALINELWRSLARRPSRPYNWLDAQPSLDWSGLF